MLLNQIKISGTYSDTKRPAVLISSQGSSINGEIYPGDVSKQYPGISTWGANKEGLLLTMLDGEYVYVPFRKGTIIEIEEVSQD